MPEDMNAEDFRKYGYQVVDWIADFLANPERFPVLSRSHPGDIKAQIPAAPPRNPESMDDVLADFENIILPGITHWNHPGFHAYFSITAAGSGILADALTSALNPNGMLWRTSPAATELEEVTLDWLRQMIGLPDVFKGIITDSASMSTMLGIAAAREALNMGIRQQGMAGRDDLPRLRLYTSDQAHSSVEKGAMTLGIGQAGVRKIPTDELFRMDAAVLEKAIEEDLDAGWRPFCVVATVGTTSTTSVDPVIQIVEICQRHKLWLHVDGAYGGLAAIVPECRGVLAGVEHADSFVTNPHKWLFTPIDLSAFYVRDPDILKRAFSLVPEYLKTPEGEVNNYMDWGVQLGRRFRALKLWMVIRQFGQDGIAAILKNHIQLGQRLAQWVDDHPDFERTAPTPFSVVCFRCCPHDIAQKLENASLTETDQLETYLENLNNAINTALNETGDVFMMPTRLKGKLTLRVAIGNIRTTEQHIAHLWELVQQQARRLDHDMRPQLMTEG